MRRQLGLEDRQVDLCASREERLDDTGPEAARPAGDDYMHEAECTPQSANFPC
jgi:hypothetical protein